MFIGPSYFITADGTPPDVDRAWRYSIMPLLEEHYFGSGTNVRDEFGLAALRRDLGEAEDMNPGDESSSPPS